MQAFENVRVVLVFRWVTGQHLVALVLGWVIVRRIISLKQFAPGEARTHGLQNMRLTRCLLMENNLSEVGFEPTPSYEDQNSL